MVDDHTKTTNQLSELVKQNDINAELPNALDEQHQATLDKLKNLEGKDFDRTYVSEQVKAHEKAVDLFQAYAIPERTTSSSNGRRPPYQPLRNT